MTGVQEDSRHPDRESVKGCLLGLGITVPWTLLSLRYSVLPFARAHLQFWTHKLRVETRIGKLTRILLLVGEKVRCRDLPNEE